MICPTCNEHDVGEPPWESWYRCANCDVHPETSLYMKAQHEKIVILEAKLEALERDLKNARIFLAERDEKLEHQAEQITRLETGQVSLRLTLTTANELITRLCDAYLDD